MPGPKPPTVVLSTAQRRALERLVSAHKTGQALVRRARVVLLAAMGYSNTDIAEQIPMDVEAVGLWRRRWVAFDAVPTRGGQCCSAAGRRARPGAVPRFSPEQVCQIVALACEQPSDSGRPISHWSHRELADEIMREASPTASRRAMRRGY